MLCGGMKGLSLLTICPAESETYTLEASAKVLATKSLQRWMWTVAPGKKESRLRGKAMKLVPIGEPSPSVRKNSHRPFLSPLASL